MNAIKDNDQDIQDVTAQVIHDMLTERTGIHMMDSGGACGRHWQRNQGRAFENEPEAVLDGSWDYLDITLNLYHWLKDRLEYNEELDKRFHTFATTGEMEDESWFACVEEFMKLLEMEAEEYGTEFGGIYGEGSPVTVNTYNHESLLSQVIQYCYWEDEDGGHVLLQIHGGADVRGGYTRAVAFDVSGNSELAMFDDGRATIYCEDTANRPEQLRMDGGSDGGPCGAHWELCNGYEEYACDPNGNDVVALKDCEIVKYDAEMEDGSDPEPGAGYIYVDEDGVPHCPICGSPLKASAF